ncbi:TIM-barrel domain-containing protein [Sphingobacterium hungaricum]|uniref:Alpha-xylosidase n=1 Tax=Sphingobacterium hungaricum TaxID=2082723 RepID=A0A928YQ67_9SPHI|nr:TIM-barrel domain-containing protein [Sphingobacterium hungaricum]MBE8713639.1 alpha-xylosidase [Sphingobacterium hungaricum]
MKKNLFSRLLISKTIRIALLALFCGGTLTSSAAIRTARAAQEQNDPIKISSVKQINPSTIEILYSNNTRLWLDFYSDQIVRLFQDNQGGIIRDPKANPEAKILVENPRSASLDLAYAENATALIIQTASITLSIDKASNLISAKDKKTNQEAFAFAKPIQFDKDRVTLTFKEQPDEFFYGGGVQNGRFSHKGKAISIENQNSWTDGGVASPTPFYWSTKGYGLLWHTFKKGRYDFASKQNNLVEAYHETDYLDVFLFFDQGAVPLLQKFYQLTGNPVLIPKFGFYQGHLNAYNRDYWKEDEKGILFEDGKRYNESQKDNGGTKESLNGELENYQFSARAVIDRYIAQDMPLGWISPNDGYGAGYGQTETLDGNIQNLKTFGDYARQKGVQIGLWTQSDLHPKPEISALLQRDIVKEVRDAGVRVLKTDVAWVGPGYSFGLNGVTDAGQIMSYYGNNARPFIISLDGWAGTQRYATIWSGDQTGGIWEYIRFHIPTYIGSGLSGQPNISSDMDGIFGGKNATINTRDFQWKTFTPMELNMDGWGSNEKYPHALGEPYTSINRTYLKLKSILMPYTYSIAHESVTGLPMIRAMFLENANAYTLGKSTQYQFMYGSAFLVAPIYQNTKADEQGNDQRDNIYLPEGQWYDYFAAQSYEGNRVINNFDAPIWKLPVFVKAGSIIPITNPNNNVSEIDSTRRSYEFYPAGISVFTEYDDDGVTEAYKAGEGTTTRIESDANGNGLAKLTIYPTEGNFKGFHKRKATSFIVNVSQRPKKLTAKIGNKSIRLTEAKSKEEFQVGQNVFYYEASPTINRFATEGSEFAKTVLTKNPQLLVQLTETDVTVNGIELTIAGFQLQLANQLTNKTGALTSPPNARVSEENREAYTLQPSWDAVANADYYEIEFNDLLYSTIKQDHFLFDNLKEETDYTFKIRSVNKEGVSDWVSFSATTKSNPLEFAIHGISAQLSVEDQGGAGVAQLFDFDEGNMWHTKWGTKAVPFDMVIDLHSINQLDKFHYLPRSGRGNGIILAGKVYTSLNKTDWKEITAFKWSNTDSTKIINFVDQPTARYIKLEVSEAVGGFGSGRELYVFKVPGTESFIPGDINSDGLIDRNDLTSYTNYTGLRLGDSDFEGYVSVGDINKNNLIDAYDISVVATQLNGGVKANASSNPEGTISLTPDKATYKPDELVTILVSGTDLKNINALSFALPYNPADYDFISTELIGMKAMDNLTNDRLHTNGVKALYPTFVNIGNEQTLSGTADLFRITLKAQRSVKFDLKAIDGILVDKNLHTITW